MSIFSNQTIVSGSVVRGAIYGNKFTLSEINTTGKITPPMREVSFDKRKLETTIRELQEIAAQLK